MKDDLDDIIERELNKAAAHINPSENLLLSVKNKILENNTEVKTMKKATVIKICAISFVILATAITCYAVGQTKHISSHSYLHYNTFPTVSQVEKDTDFKNPKFPKELGFGYTFKSYSPGDQEGIDDNGAVTAKAKFASFQYENSEMPENVYMALNIDSTAINTSDEVKNYNMLIENKYKFVPPDYEITAEEQKLMDAGELYISYGSAEIEEKIIQNYSWEENDCVYTLMGFDTGFSENEFKTMCETVKNS